MRLQREIEQFLIDRAETIKQWKAFSKDPENNEKPDGNRPPEVRNFNVRNTELQFPFETHQN